MKEDQNKVKRYIKRKYRVHVFNADTHENFFSSHLTGTQIFLGVITTLFLLLVLAFAAYYFTPLKYTIPGYGKNISEKKLAMLTESVRTLENQVRIQDQYIRSVRSLVSGRPIEELLKDSLNTVNENTEVNYEPVPKVPEDEQLRKLNEDKTRQDALNNALTEEKTSTSPVQSLDDIEFMAPLKGKVSKDYDDGDAHYGIDIIAPKGSPVKSVLDGTVVFSGYAKDTGYTIILQHSNDLVSIYKHNSKNLKEIGDRVKAGEAIAIIGNTGNHTSGPHLHFELWNGNNSIRPQKFIRFD